MKLWEIEAMSLRLMFADSGVQFSLAEFTNGSLRSNSGTREKLVRMTDSIRRGIDLYYSYVGEKTRTADYGLAVSGTTKLNKLTITAADFGFPTRVDVFIYQTVDGVDELHQTNNQVDFVYDDIAKEITFIHADYTAYYTDYTDVVLVFKVWYKTSKLNIPDAANELTYDLDTIYIPAEVQRMLPYFVKGELYEEDEYSLAQQAKNEFVRFLLSIRKPFVNVQHKVKRAKLFDKE